jgi:hypothetical protein
MDQDKRYRRGLLLDTVVRALTSFSDARTLTDLMAPQSRKASFTTFGIVLVVFGALLDAVARFIRYIEPPGDRSDQTTVETHHRELHPFPLPLA